MSVPRPSRPIAADDLAARIERECMLVDRHRLLRQLRQITTSHRPGGRRPLSLEALKARVDQSAELFNRRARSVPKIPWPPDLPIVDRREEIAAAINGHQVVVICGETGSGKSTQLPKICLELGRGIAGTIGHTQPRRIAARSIASRIAEELGVSVGSVVGYKVRFGDAVAPHSLIKVMTDGILLAETQSSRFLDEYDTIIIDEAHERSLNIDFLLGYLHRLLPRRPDLKVIITSATIDPQRFSDHFNGAPIIEVSGRTYPVDIRYRPVETGTDEEIDQRADSDAELGAIVAAVNEILAEDRTANTLVFLPGERQIRDAARALRKHAPPDLDVLPLYARLPDAEQQRIFRPRGGGRRVVLATNVAETSLTVPGITAVVDTGLARISRYSAARKVQRLPIEPISQASANQRAGRCGRIAPGICIRLYSETDYASREAFTPPEILRSNLAAVILRMKALHLGEIENFPFLDAPRPGTIRDAYATLHELNAVDDARALTPLGDRLARLPIDPRLARMLVAADREGCLSEVLTIASLLEAQDPRERPHDRQEAADQAHLKYRDEHSDFISILNLWKHVHEQKARLSSSQLRRSCTQQFLSWPRLREWMEVHRQLRELCLEQKLRLNRKPADHASIHRALMTGLLSNIARKDEQSPSREYKGAGGKTLAIHPGSALFRSTPRWIMAGELVETTRLYARTVAKIQPEWIEPLAQHLVKRDYAEPHWQDTSAQVVAYERVTLFGLEIVSRRLTHYGPVDPAASREIFIHHALVLGEYRSNAPFFRHNASLVQEVERMEAKARRRDLLADVSRRYAFFDARIPADVYSGSTFEKWRKEAEKTDPRLLYLSRDDLLNTSVEEITPQRYPDRIEINEQTIPLRYRFEPGHPADGVTLRIPLEALNQVDTRQADWLVPGLLEEKVLALIKSLPKHLRTAFLPASDWAKRCAVALERAGSPSTPLTEALAEELSRISGLRVAATDFQTEKVPEHLAMNYNVLDERGKVLDAGRDLDRLRARLRGKTRAALNRVPTANYPQSGITFWSFGDLPQRIDLPRKGGTVIAYPAVVDHGRSVSIELRDDADAAAAESLAGIRRLFLLAARDDLRAHAASLPHFDRIAMLHATLGPADRLRNDLLALAADRAFIADADLPRTQADFEARLRAGLPRLHVVVGEVCSLALEILTLRHELTIALLVDHPPAWRETIADLKAQLHRLFPPGFLTATPRDRLIHLPRYLRAMQHRLERRRHTDSKRKQEMIAELTELYARYEQRRAALDALHQGSADLDRFRWLLEEYRVSLFAQPLGTAEPVSRQRLERLWETIAAK